MIDNKNKKLIIVLIFIFALSSILFSQGVMNQFKDKEEEKTKSEGPKVALLPFEYTFETGEIKGKVSLNEVAASMIRTKKFQPFSAEKWISQEFDGGKAKNTDEIINKAIKENLPVDYICHGIIFKAGKKYGLKLTMYPTNNKMFVTYYFRYFNNFYHLNKIADSMVVEMSKRAESITPPLFDKTVLVNNFDVKFTLQTKSKTGEVSVSALPFINIKGVEYKNEDNFFNELFLYNFHIARVFNVKNNNMKRYVSKNSTASNDVDYIVTGTIDISKEVTIVTVSVTNNVAVNTKRRKKNNIPKQLYFKQYYFYNMSLDNIYNVTREYTKHIIMALLTDEERKKLGEVNLEAFYGEDTFYTDNIYLGSGNLNNLLFPINASSEIETRFTEKWRKIKYINIKPLSTSNPENPFFKVSLGFSIDYRIMFHPIYDDMMELTYNGIDYKLDDINKEIGVDNFFSYANVSNQIGIGFDVFLESKHFGIISSISVIFGEYFRQFNVTSNETFVIDTYEFTNYKAIYNVNKFSIITDFSFLPVFMLLKNDSPVRLFGGVGFSFSIWYNQFQASINSEATINSATHTFKEDFAAIKTVHLTLGLFPEFGVTYKLLKFNFRWSLAYNFDMYKYNVFTDTHYSILDTFNTSTLTFKFGFGCYIN